MLGPIMDVKVTNKLTIRLAPFTREQVGEFIRNGGLQQYSVSRYVGVSSAPTLETEQEWYDKIRTDKNCMVWGIWDTSCDPSRLIGSTALNSLEEQPLRQMTSGSLIFDKSYWGRGIATAIHKARTYYAFDQLNLTRIKSAVLLPNIASKKALEKSGYFFHSTERNVQFIDGKFQHQENFECLNPAELEWSRWWNDDQPSEAAMQARKTTLDALDWAAKNVTIL